MNTALTYLFWALLILVFLFGILCFYIKSRWLLALFILTVVALAIVSIVLMYGDKQLHKKLEKQSLMPLETKV